MHGKHIHIGSTPTKSGVDKHGKYSLGNCHHEATTVPTKRGMASGFRKRAMPRATTLRKPTRRR